MTTDLDGSLPRVALDVGAAADEVIAGPPISARRRFVRRFMANKPAVLALAFLVFMCFVAVFGSWIAPFHPNDQDLPNKFASPFKSRHVFGTDQFGRDTLSRLIAGTRIAVEAVVRAVTIAVVVGVPPGLAAGYFGGKVDLWIMRFTEAVQAIPGLVLAIAIVGIRGPGLGNAMAAVGLIFFPNFLRITRASVLEVREETYIEASRSIGTPSTRILRTRILPQVLPPLIVQISLACGFALLAEASLSFLGLGVAPPQSSWGSMLGAGYNVMNKQSWLVVFPGALIALTVLAFNVVGDGLRDSIGREVRRER